MDSVDARAWWGRKLSATWQAAAFVYGYMEQNFDLTAQAWLVAMGVALLVCVPDYPMYNANPVPFAKELPEEDARWYREREREARAEEAAATTTSSSRSCACGTRARVAERAG